jgi:cell division protein FtsQ
MAGEREGQTSVTVTAPADRRFLRAQVKPGRRHAPWRPWLRLLRRSLAGVLLVAAGWRGAMAIAEAPALRVDRVTVAGAEHLSNGEVLGLVEGLRGRNILFVHLEEWRRQVLTCPWVADVTLRRSLPRTVEVHIVERRAIAIGRVGEALFLVDEHGDEIDEYGPRYADFDLPIIEGLVRSREQDDQANERRMQLASRLLRDLRNRPDLARRISQLDVSDPRNAVVIVDQDTTRVRLGDERFAERLQSYVDLAPSLHEHVPDVEYVDLRFGERVVVGSQAGAAAGRAGQGSGRQAGGLRRGSTRE